MPASESDKDIGIDAFVPAGSVDPLYFGETSYYRLPDGAVGKSQY
jgi:non-homologous end joining protein Ku